MDHTPRTATTVVILDTALELGFHLVMGTISIIPMAVITVVDITVVDITVAVITVAGITAKS